MKCKVCGSNSYKIFVKQLLGKYDVQYYKCPECDFINTEKPFWLKEAYEESINLSDTGILSRNQNLAEKLTPVFAMFFDKNASFLDWGGGYGLFVRTMRDIGFDFKWHDPYTQNLFARNFEINPGEQYEVVTCFEVFEHLEFPIDEIKKILEYSDTIVFSTNLSDSVSDIGNWDYLCPDHGQHISFYSYKTLASIARLFDMKLLSNRKNIHILTRKRLKNKFITELLLGIRHRYGILIFEVSKLFVKSKTVEDSSLLK